GGPNARAVRRRDARAAGRRPGAGRGPAAAPRRPGGPRAALPRPARRRLRARLGDRHRPHGHGRRRPGDVRGGPRRAAPARGRRRQPPGRGPPRDRRRLRTGRTRMIDRDSAKAHVEKATAQIREALGARGVDALLVTYPANVRYLTGFSSPKDASVLVLPDRVV